MRMMSKNDMDFANAPVKRLFGKMFFPTIVGMVSLVVLNMTDGAFVGHGVGAVGLAAVNIVAPLFMVLTGIGLMFGIGSSVVVSLKLAREQYKMARINATQAVVAGMGMGVFFAALILAFMPQTCRIFGATDHLVPVACDYMFWIAMVLPLSILAQVGMFLVRIDGSPKFASFLNVLVTLVNIVLDWLLIFEFKMGVEGAAIATAVSYSVSAIGALVYMLWFSRVVSFCRLKISLRGFDNFLKNVFHQMKLGFSALLGELAMALLFIVGNYQFLNYLGEDGVAAFSVGCYCLPIAFMFGNAVVQSAQPIISFAYGVGNHAREREASALALRTALIIGVAGLLFMWLGAELVSTIFLDTTCKAWEICCEGLPFFSITFLFSCLNLAAIGYYQSVEQTNKSNSYTFLRGYLFMIPSFLVLPSLLGAPGLWLALPATELVTFIIIVIVAVVHRKK